MALVKYNNNSISTITTAGTLTSGNLTLIKEQTASSSSTIDFVDGSSSVVLDNTYSIYMFKFINMHPSSDGAEFMFQANASGESGFNETVQTSFFLALHNEAGGTTNLVYETDHDAHPSTSYTELHGQNSSDSDHGMCGELFLFQPSNTNHVKHFLVDLVVHHQEILKEMIFLLDILTQHLLLMNYLLNFLVVILIQVQ